MNDPLRWFTAASLRWFVTVAIFVGLTWQVRAANAQSDSPPRADAASSPNGSADPSTDGQADIALEDAKPDAEAYEDRDAQRFYERVFRRLKRMKPREANQSESSRKNESDDDKSFSAESQADELSAQPLTITDSFVIGTAAVDPRTQNADVCFRAIAGVDQTAKEITRFQGETFARGEISYWQVFYRVSKESDAQHFLAQVQRKYDETVAYRNQLMQQYNARTIRRC